VFECGKKVTAGRPAKDKGFQSTFYRIPRQIDSIEIEAVGEEKLGRGHIAYSMAMGAVVQMTRELSTEWSGRGVRVNAILPAQVINPGLEARMAADPNLRDKFLSGIPIGRFGQPDDIKGLSVFLASDASSWITGALIPMDGGNLAMNAGGSIGKA
jgi:NAD(P)-dependent dehydrogenase (short-subunit alcohol dehydrogenase family)